jgi:hypothetical protein
LQLAKEIAEVLGVVTSATATSLIGVLGNRQPGRFKGFRDHCVPSSTTPGFLSFEDLVGESPEGIYGVLCPQVRLIGAATHPEHPTLGETVVILGFLEGLRGDSGENLIVATGEIGPELKLVTVEEELSHNGVGKVAVGLFHQQQVEEGSIGSTHGESVFVPAPAFNHSSALKDQSSDAEMVESKVSQRYVDL